MTDNSEQTQALPASKEETPPFTVERYGSFGAAIMAENRWLRAALERIKRIGPLGVDTYPECYRRMHAIAVAALSGEPTSAVETAAVPLHWTLVRTALDDAAKALPVLFDMCAAAGLRQGAVVADEILGNVNAARKQLTHAMPLPATSSEKASEPPLTLIDFGYAPGVYAFHCLDCDQEALGGKRAIRCKACAQKALSAQNGRESQ